MKLLRVCLNFLFNQLFEVQSSAKPVLAAAVSLNHPAGVKGNLLLVLVMVKHPCRANNNLKLIIQSELHYTCPVFHGIGTIAH